MFELPGHSFTLNHSFAHAAAYSEHLTICLLSALRFHEIGTQLPHVLWIAIPYSSRAPKIPDIEVQVVRMNALSFKTGVEEHIIEGRTVKIFTAAKTVADCFKYRSSVGMEVAIEALKDGLWSNKFTGGDLYEVAKADRVWNVMEPYVEALS